MHYRQTPILVISFSLVALKVNIKLPADVQDQTITGKLGRIDFVGSLTLVGTIGCLLVSLSLKTSEEIPWSDPLIWGLLIASAICGVLFILAEARWAPYPVMPLRLITQRTPLAVSLGNFFCSISAFSTVCSFILQYTPSAKTQFLKIYNIPIVSGLRHLYNHRY